MENLLFLYKFRRCLCQCIVVFVYQALSREFVYIYCTPLTKRWLPKDFLVYKIKEHFAERHGALVEISIHPAFKCESSPPIQVPKSFFLIDASSQHFEYIKVKISNFHRSTFYCTFFFKVRVACDSTKKPTESFLKSLNINVSVARQLGRKTSLFKFSSFPLPSRPKRLRKLILFRLLHLLQLCGEIDPEKVSFSSSGHGYLTTVFFEIISINVEIGG